MKYIYVYIVLLIGFIGFAQGENDNWYFGSGRGVNFSSSSPTALYGGQITTPAATATVSDQNGNLLFYTNGMSVWNREHQLMPNGTGLSGTGNTQQVVISPYPGSTSLYYIFAMGVYGSSVPSTYSIVDMSIGTIGSNGLPLGDVTTIKNVSLLNQAGLPFTYSSENAALIAHSDKKSYWLLFYNDEKIYSYRIDSNGLNILPVMSSLPTPTANPGPYLANARAHIRVSKTFDNRPYTNLISISRSSGTVTNHNIPRVFSFDNSTGAITNDYFWSTIPFGFTSTEFSENGDILYGISPNGSINNFDLTWVPGMPNYDQLVYAGTNNFSNSYIQKATDGKIYIAKNSTSNNNNFLGVITNQNDLYLSDFVPQAINVGSSVKAGLPPLIDAIDGSETGCWENLILSVPETNNVTHQVSATITTNNQYTVNTGQTVSLKAGNYVLMLPETTILENSVFTAEIDGCTPAAAKSLKVQKQEPIVIYKSAEDFLTKITVYPNPASDVAKIALTGSNIIDINVYTKEGRLIFNTTVNETSYDLNTSNFEKGIYILTVTTNNGEVLTQKIIKN
ncbi:T9SS type A sorting domain-containing protein [Flavobacterium sp. NRK1]|uniref:T9SS type A sorting domain-containing protein n=1 Tax=Flavobacterium sp. NRK1 TaxID=2954929 RepID=UPI0020931BBE|nr:T9SS type A sorting domain-containing protein [Flavobacterium sp. NRK1]MCO6148509.1 T9SS type A sorting domain-containing protein [Flavobacterium sp. NRK1]